MLYQSATCVPFAGGGRGVSDVLLPLAREPCRSNRVLCCGTAPSQLCGINAVFYYSTSFFVGVIDNPDVGTALVGLVNVVATLAATALMDATGQ
jgi:SP family facilitated glucose transporter-like MFS transporter 3